MAPSNQALLSVKVLKYNRYAIFSDNIKKFRNIVILIL